MLPSSGDWTRSVGRRKSRLRWSNADLCWRLRVVAEAVSLCRTGAVGNCTCDHARSAYADGNLREGHKPSRRFDSGVYLLLYGIGVLMIEYFVHRLRRLYEQDTPLTGPQ